MIVDDDRNILQSCRRILMDEDYACTVFNSPLKALDALPRVKPAVIISDQRMPDPVFCHKPREKCRNPSGSS